MKLRYTIRSALFVTALIACACGWYAWNVAERQHEMAILNDLERVTKRGVVIVDGKHPYDGCGTWSGAIAHLECCGPEFLRKLNLDAFKRVVRIEVQREQNPEIIAVIGRFEHIEELLLENGSIDAANKVLPEEIGYVSAVRHFRSSNPTIDVSFWDYNDPNDTID